MNLLFIDATIRHSTISRTKRLSDFFMEQLPLNGVEVKTVQLMHTRLNPMTERELNIRNELKQKQEFGNPFFDYARNFAEADYILIAAPFWNLSLPALLDTYLEWVCMPGITFGSDGVNYIGMCKAKKLLLISSAGFALHGINNGSDHLAQLAKEFFGIKQFDCICPEELDVAGIDAKARMEAAQEALQELAKNWMT